MTINIEVWIFTITISLNLFPESYQRSNINYRSKYGRYSNKLSIANQFSVEIDSAFAFKLFSLKPRESFYNKEISKSFSLPTSTFLTFFYNFHSLKVIFYVSVFAEKNLVSNSYSIIFSEGNIFP